MTAIVDTNVILVANRQHDGVGEACVASCARRLEDLMAHGRVALDDGYRMLKEYQRKSAPRAGKRAGDLFVKWLLRNNANAARCDLVPLVEHAQRVFESFPDDARLRDFDRPDRVFVAVAAAHAERPPILQAADAKWLGWAEALRDHGVDVQFLCPDDIRAFGDKRTPKDGA